MLDDVDEFIIELTELSNDSFFRFVKILSLAKNRIITNGGHFDWLHPDSSSFDALLEVLGEHDK